MFGSKNNISEEEFLSLKQLVEKLQKKQEESSKKIQQLQQKVAELEEQQLRKQMIDGAEGYYQSFEQVQEPVSTYVAPAVNADSIQHCNNPMQYYLAAPSVDGVFSAISPTEQIGKSIYLLTCSDDSNGQFILLDTPDAVSTAMISVSQFIKPVCKIEGNTHVMPRHIVTIEEGSATKDNGVWKVTRKAVVKFE